VANHIQGSEIDRLIADRSEQSRLRFFVVGDFGSGDDGQAKVADAIALTAEHEPPDFILGTGDSVYPLNDAGNIGVASPATALAERFDPYYARLGVDFFQCIGNEDLLNVFGGDPAPMLAHTWSSTTWRMPARHYSIPRLPPWIAIHIADTTVFGFGNRYAERTVFSEELMNRELEALSETFAACAGLKILVGHHPIFTAGKRTVLDNGDGELLCMRRLREAIEDCGVHFYFSGHEHQQSHMAGPTCEHIIQGCGGARLKPNLRHPRRDDGWRDAEKALRYFGVFGGFAIVDVDAARGVRLRFLGIPLGEPAHAVRIIHEFHWNSPDEIGDRSLQRLARQPYGSR
jgi:hypothetical protein